MNNIKLKIEPMIFTVQFEALSLIFVVLGHGATNT